MRWLGLAKAAEDETPAKVVKYGFFGNFYRCAQFCGSALLPNGKVIVVPSSHPSILIFDPDTRTHEEFGQFDSPAKWNGCGVLPDGRVVFVPSRHPSILIVDPNAKTWEEVGSFREFPKWNGCAVLHDGRVIFAPDCHSAILLFDPSSKTWEEVGDFQGYFKWSGCALLPNGRVVFSPFDHASILIFDPNTKAYEFVGKFTESAKFSGCVALEDGKVVFAPANHHSILVLDCNDRTWEEMEVSPGKMHPNYGCLQARTSNRKWSSCGLMPDGRVVFFSSQPSLSSRVRCGCEDFGRVWMLYRSLQMGRMHRTGRRKLGIRAMRPHEHPDCRCIICFVDCAAYEVFLL